MQGGEAIAEETGKPNRPGGGGKPQKTELTERNQEVPQGKIHSVVHRVVRRRDAPQHLYCMLPAALTDLGYAPSPTGLATPFTAVGDVAQHPLRRRAAQLRVAVGVSSKQSPG